MEKKQAKTKIDQDENSIFSDANLTNNSCHICNAKFKDSHTLSDHLNTCNLYCQDCNKCIDGTFENGNIFPNGAIHIWHDYQNISKQM